MRPRPVRVIKKLPLIEIQAGDDRQITGDGDPGDPHQTTHRKHRDFRRPEAVRAPRTGTVAARRARTLSDLSWPQAAAMSRPRGVRTGAE